ncbi:MAG: substrate-binding domain-containing protein [Anaerolineales bacterium]|nr:substrate-binding domain-containing protein [Anaerolineales bacterium]
MGCKTRPTPYTLLPTLFLLLTACTTQPAPPPDLPPTPAVISLRIGVASSAVGVVGLVTEPYGEERPFTHLQFILANSAALWQGLADGTLDAALLHVIPADNDRWFNPVALDGLAVVVNPANPVRSLSLAQVQGLFSGQMSSWQEVGGKDAPVTLISREPGSGARTLLAQQVLGERRLALNAQIVADQAAVLAAVAGEETAVGYAMIGSVGEGVVMVEINGRLPTPNETGTQNYPLTTPLYFVNATPDEPQGELRAFLAWLQSLAGQAILAQKYGRVR